MKARVCLSLLCFALSPARTASAEEAPAPAEIVPRAINAVGGEAKMLRLFRIKERLNSGSTLAAPDVAKTWESIIEAPRCWRLNRKDRTGEPAKFDVWGWNLGVLTDPATVVEGLAGVEENGVTTIGLRVSGAVDPAMDLDFVPTTWRLIARNLLFHPFGILVTLGPREEGVQGEVGDESGHHR